jgi:hypothetical protein
LFEQKALLKDIAEALPAMLFEAPKPEAAKPRGGGGGGSAGPRAESETEKRLRLAKQEREETLRMMRVNREFTKQIEENSRIREERLAAETKAAEEWFEAQSKAVQEALALERSELADPILGFADALTSNLVPGLEEVEQTMARVASIFDQFREGQMGVNEALGKGATELAAFAAKAIGGVRAEAAVRAVYETAMGFANIANPAVAAGHFTAAALLAGVAGGVIGGGSGGAKPGKAPDTAKKKERDEATGGDRNVVYNIQAGVMDGQSVSRAIRQSERSSRGTGHGQRAGV